MLQMNKTVQLAASSMIEEQTVMQLNATIDVTDGVKTTYFEQIIDQGLYRDNKEAVRADIEEFRNQMYDIEDSEKAVQETTEEPKEDAPVE